MSRRWSKNGKSNSHEQPDSGQAALLASVLIPAVLLAGLFVFNTSQSSATKIRTQNAADAAAFSAMQMEARELNFISYTNRAMVANQVAIGQTISLVSWVHYVKNLGINIKTIGQISSLIPGVGSIIVTITNAIAQTTQVLDQSIETTSRVVLPALDITDAALSGAQEVYHFSNGVFDPGGGSNKPGGAMTAVAEQVVKFNDPQAQLNGIVLASNLAAYFQYRSDLIQRWGSDKDQAQARMAYMINASRDGFTQQRNDLPLPFSPKIIRQGDFGVVGWEFRRAGASSIIHSADGKYAWSGMDTLSFHSWRRKGIIFGGKKWTETTLGYGASQTGGGNNYTYAPNYTEIQATPQEAYSPIGKAVSLPAYENSWRRNPNASGKAANQYSEEQNPFGAAAKPVGGDATRFSSGGISRYWDFNRESQKLLNANGDPADIMPYYVAVVEHQRQRLRDSSGALDINKIPDQEKMNIVLPQNNSADYIRSIAKAQVYFRRPASLWARKDHYYERGNLFSPYWEARLVDLNSTDRARYATILCLQK
ncbi:MAG: pilus assembly protein TadG-related protein [Acidithiobacillus sp.]